MRAGALGLFFALRETTKKQRTITGRPRAFFFVECRTRLFFPGSSVSFFFSSNRNKRGGTTK